MDNVINYNKRLSKELNNLNLSYVFNGTEIKTYWCRIAIREKDFNDKLHAHSFYEVHFCLSGWAKFIVDNKEYVLTQNQFAFVPKKCQHQIIENSEDFEKLVWGVDIRCAEREEQYNNFTVMLYTEQTLSLLCLILQNVKKKENDWYYYVKQYLYCFWTEIARAMSSQNGAKKETESVSFKSGIEIETIKRYVLDNLKHRVKVADVAKQLAISERQLFRLFLSKYGMSVREYIYQLQMEEAKRLLIETAHSIAEISEKIGYSDRFSFDRAFERYEGMSPAQFRLSIQK